MNLSTLLKFVPSSKATGAELDTGTDDAKFATAKALKDSHNVPSVAPGTSGNVLTSNGTDWTSAAASGADGADGISFIWKGAYSAGTTYVVNDAVSYNGSSYICILESTGNLPTNETYWNLMAQKGADGEGTGDVSGPASATDSNIAVFDGITGKLIKDGGATVASKVTANTAITGATKTKITYDAKGLVTSGADATTADIADSSNKRYVSDAQLVVIGNTSGTNTGDQDLSGLVAKSTYDAHTVLYATTDNTPAALTVGEQTIVGRATGGNISALSIDSDLSSVSANDDTIPSAKATKAALDAKAPLASPTFTGTVTLPEVQLGEASMKLDAALSADGKWSGITEVGTAGATLAFGDLCYFQASDSRWELVDANLSAGYDKKLGMCILAAASDGSATEMLLIGKIRADAKFPTLTIGSPAYMSETAGAIVVAQPTTADVCIRVIGYGNTADELWFNPSQDFITHT